MTSVSSPFQRSSRLIRAVASLCILTQILFPVATTASHPTTERNTAPATVEDFLTPVASGAALNAPPQEDNAARVAAAASQAGGMLQSGMNSRQVADMARGYVTGTAQSAFQEWLSQWGTARVTLGLDGDFSLKASSFDLLLPWHDTPENLLFTTAPTTATSSTPERAGAILHRIIWLA